MELPDFAVPSLIENDKDNTDQVKQLNDQMDRLSLTAANNSLVLGSTSTQLSESLDKLEQGFSALSTSVSGIEAGKDAADPLILVALACGVISLLLGLASLAISIKASRGSKMSEQVKSV